MKRLGALLAVAACVLAACGGSSHSTQKLSPGPAQCPGYVTAYGCSAHSPTFGLPHPGFPTLTAPSSTPTVEMRDAVSVSAIPAGTPAVAGYLSGFWPTFRPLVLAFPRAYHVPVAIGATPVYKSLVGRMSCLDIEPGDATPAEGGPWAKGEIGLGVKPCEYANESTMPAVKASLAHWLGSGWRAKVFLWVAAWTYHPGLLAGYDADQWTNHGPQGQNYDESTVSRAFLGIKPPPPPLPVCFTHRMTRFQCNGVKEQIAKDQRAAASSQSAYVARGCPTLSQRVSWFSTQLREHPKVRTASRRRALAASRKAYRTQSCSVFAQRQRFFSARAVSLRSAS